MLNLGSTSTRLWLLAYCVALVSSLNISYKSWNTLIPILVTRPPGYNTFFMLNSIEHEISSAHNN